MCRPGPLTPDRSAAPNLHLSLAPLSVLQQRVACHGVSQCFPLSQSPRVGPRPTSIRPSQLRLDPDGCRLGAANVCWTLLDVGWTPNRLQLDPTDVGWTVQADFRSTWDIPEPPGLFCSGYELPERAPLLLMSVSGEGLCPSPALSSFLCSLHPVVPFRRQRLCTHPHCPAAGPTSSNS